MKTERIYGQGIILAFMLMLTLPYALSFDGSGGGISMNGAIGGVVFNVNSTTSSMGGMDWLPVGSYLSSDISGRLMSRVYHEDPYINIEIINPAYNSVITESSITLSYNIATNINVDNCSLYMDDQLENTQYSLLNGTYDFGIANMAPQRHNISVECHSWNIDTKAINGFTTIITSYGGTNLSDVNISAIPNLTISDAVGGITFSGLTDLSSGANLNDNIIISPLSIYVNSAVMPQLDRPAKLTMNNVPYSYVLIFRDGTLCNDCSIDSLSSGTLIFNVQGFSNYTVSPNSKLQLFDDTDTMPKFSNETVTFTANYTNLTSGQPIIGNCQIYLNETPQMMIYSSGLYSYSAIFNSSRTTIFNVSCSPSSPGYADLSGSDTYSILQANSGFLAHTTIKEVSSTRSNAQAAAIYNASAGNLTEIVFNGSTITSSWQGYYGNVTGRILLADANNNTFYNWVTTSSNGEIFAVRVPNPDWNRIRCANASQIAQEDAYVGTNPAIDGDAVNNTFRNTTAFNPFYVGAISIDPSQNCHAANMYNATGLSTRYSEIILTDTNSIIYTGLLASGASGFDGGGHDFQIIVGQNGHAGGQTLTNYYFFLELV